MRVLAKINKQSLNGFITCLTQPIKSLANNYLKRTLLQFKMLYN